MRPQRAGDELQEGEDARGARLGRGGGGGGEGGGAVEEEWEEALAEGEALDGESVFRGGESAPCRLGWKECNWPRMMA